MALPMWRLLLKDFLLLKFRHTVFVIFIVVILTVATVCYLVANKLGYNRPQNKNNGGWKNKFKLPPTDSLH